MDKRIGLTIFLIFLLNFFTLAMAHGITEHEEGSDSGNEVHNKTEADYGQYEVLNNSLGNYNSSNIETISFSFATSALIILSSLVVFRKI